MDQQVGFILETPRLQAPHVALLLPTDPLTIYVSAW